MQSWLRKPGRVRAVQWDGTEAQALHLIEHEMAPILVGPFHAAIGIGIQTSEGIMQLKSGDWIVQGAAGDWYPVKADVFHDLYEPDPDTEEP